MVKIILQCVLCTSIGFVCGIYWKHEKSNKKTVELQLLSDWLIEFYAKCEAENNEGRRREKLMEELFGALPGTASSYIFMENNLEKD